MYSDENLNAIAEQARQRLKEQEKVKAKDKITKIDSNSMQDIYKDFKKEDSNASEEATQKNYDIKHEPVADDVYAGLNIEQESNDQSEQHYDDINEYDDVIFEGGPLQSEVLSWKKQYEGYDIYAIELLDQYFVFRTLNRYEYKQIIAIPNIDALQREEIFCETVTLWPPKYDYAHMAVDKAGIPSMFAKIIMDKSGFTNDFKILKI